MPRWDNPESLHLSFGYRVDNIETPNHDRRNVGETVRALLTSYMEI